MVQGQIPGTTPEILPEDLVIIREADNLEALAQIGHAENLAPPETFVDAVKKDTKLAVNSQDNLEMFNHVKQLVKQGKYLELAHLEQTDATWKGYIYNLPKGTMKFVLNSTIDTLPTKVNLKMWGKVSNDKCRCGRKETLNHILNCCHMSLKEGRFTFRHDNILQYISKCIDTTKYEAFIDMCTISTHVYLFLQH